MSKIKLTVLFSCVIFISVGGVILEQERIKEIALAIFEKHHAVVSAMPMTRLFELLEQEKAFDYLILPRFKIKFFFQLVDNHLKGQKSMELYLLEKAPLVWSAYLNKKSRTKEIMGEIKEISQFTGISEQEICEFFKTVKKIKI
ncbi:MAG: hypothetical protein WC427_03225 [Candidatus Paceibacterota bacterium]